MNSYQNIKDFSGGKAREDLSESCSEEKNDSVLFDPVSLKAQRRHSSFGDSIFFPFTPPYNGRTHPDHSPTFAHDAPSTNGASKTANHRFSYTVQPSSDNDDPLSKRTPLQSTPSFLRKPKSFSVSQIKGDAVTSDYPDSMLLRLQAASLGCGHGVWPCGEVRRVMCESVTNTELDNYKLSLKRES